VDGPEVAKTFYQDLLAQDIIDADAVPYALDAAVENIRRSGVSIERWASFVHIGL
jgi:hypothetical protein